MILYKAKATEFAWNLEIQAPFWSKYFLFTLHKFSSPERRGLICNEPVALDAKENTNFFIWLKGIECAELRATKKRRASGDENISSSNCQNLVEDRLALRNLLTHICTWKPATQSKRENPGNEFDLLGWEPRIGRAWNLYTPKSSHVQRSLLRKIGEWGVSYWRFVIVYWNDTEAHNPHWVALLFSECVKNDFVRRLMVVYHYRVNEGFWFALGLFVKTVQATRKYSRISVQQKFI